MDEETLKQISRMCAIILGNTFGNRELDSLAFYVGHHPLVLNPGNSAHALVRRVQELEDENESLTLQIKELGDENAELVYMFDSYYKTTHDATRRFQGRIAELEDWQARVLPWLRRQQDYLKNKSDEYPDSSTSVNAKIDADELTALIAEAKE